MDAVQGFDFEVMAGGYGNADRGALRIKTAVPNLVCCTVCNEFPAE
jgi:hypothetical protein